MVRWCVQAHRDTQGLGVILQNRLEPWPNRCRVPFTLHNHLVHPAERCGFQGLRSHF